VLVGAVLLIIMLILVIGMVLLAETLQYMFLGMVDQLRMVVEAVPIIKMVLGAVLLVVLVAGLVVVLVILVKRVKGVKALMVAMAVLLLLVGGEQDRARAETLRVVAVAAEFWAVVVVLVDI
jgi:hypothetical protein